MKCIQLFAFVNFLVNYPLNISNKFLSLTYDNRGSLRWSWVNFIDNFCLKIIFSEKATKFFEISTLLLSYVEPVKSKVEISQNFVAFSEYMNFTYYLGKLF